MTNHYPKSHLCSECIKPVPAPAWGGSPARVDLHCPVEHPTGGGCSDECSIRHACSEHDLAAHIYRQARSDGAHLRYFVEHYPGVPCSWCGEPIVGPDQRVSFSCPRNDRHPHGFWLAVERVGVTS